MIDEEKRAAEKEARARVTRRVRVQIDPDKYRYFPEEEEKDYFDDEVNQRVAIYARVSTGSIMQATSYELQKKYYEEFVSKHPNWTLVDIYADQGISGTSTLHRKQFNRMIDDCKQGQIDMILTKSVSRFARNVTDFLGTIRNLAEMKPRVGVFFEMERVFSLKEDNQLSLSFLASMAEEESHIRSRSMETSLRMRLDNGMPLTPKLLGYTHDKDGNLIVNPAEASTVRLAFSMYIFGYSTQQIADEFIKRDRRSYLGNTTKWTSNSIVDILRQERHCGDVLTRKTYTPNFRDHKSKKNHGQRPQSLYYDHHEAIVSRDDFIAVQHMLDNAKYGNKSVLPELRVIESGIFKGYVVINPRWGGFKPEDYINASRSALVVTESSGESNLSGPGAYKISVAPGDFDFRGFEIARSELFDSNLRPFATFSEKGIQFSAECTKRFASRNFVEILINPLTGMLAVRPTDKGNRCGVMFSKLKEKRYVPRQIPAAAFIDMIYTVFGWQSDRRYRIIGTLYEQGNELAYIFDSANSEIYFNKCILPVESTPNSGQPLTAVRNYVRAIPKEWTTSFGKQFYLHEQTMAELAAQNEEDWKLRLEGRLFETGEKLNVTGFDELKTFIIQELGGLP
nr:recombinase family protein [Clostridia bacterium]